jgi:hypothetical protein
MLPAQTLILAESFAFVKTPEPSSFTEIPGEPFRILLGALFYRENPPAVHHGHRLAAVEPTPVLVPSGFQSQSQVPQNTSKALWRPQEEPAGNTKP